MATEQLSREQLEIMLDVGKVDAGNGTLFGVENKRAPRKQGLTLVISSGGSGMSAIREAMKTANQKLTPDFATYVKFIVVDSSTGEIEAMKKLGIDVINISSPAADQRMIASNRDFFYKKFVPADYNVTLLNSDGASQDRMTGKIKLYDKNGGKTNDEILRDHIENLFKNDWKGFANLPVDIMILSGISGGNGSGTFLDIAAQARRACPNKNDVRVYGYLMLPDTAERYASSTASKNSLYRNGFAALKELESYMSIDFEDDRKELFPSQVAANDVEVSNVNRLYDFPVLISGDYDAAVSMIAETIVNSIADSDGKFEQRAFYSNNLTIRATTMSEKEMMNAGILKADACPEDSHLYCGIGFAHASIPEKIVIPNVVSRVNRKMYTAVDTLGVQDAQKAAFCTKDRRLTRIEFETAMRTLLGLDNRAKLDANSLKNKVLRIFSSKTGVGENQYEVTYDQLATGDFREYLKGFNVEKTVNKAVAEFPVELQKLYTSIETQARLIMNTYGPRAIEYLYEGKGNDDEKGVPENYSDISLRHQIEVVASEFNKMANTPGRYPGTIQVKGFFGKLVDSIMVKTVDEWCQTARSAAQTDIYCKVSQRMTGGNGGWKTEFDDRIVRFKEYCSRFASVIETMMDYYTGVGSSLDEADYKKFASSTGDPNGVNLCSDAAVYGWVRGRVETKVNGINVIDAKRALIDDFYENLEAWISGEPGKARRQFDDVMSRICSVGKYSGATGGLNLTITDYFEEVLKDIPQTEQTIRINNSVDDIMRRLIQTSTPSLELKGDKFGHINKVILVPRKLMTGSHGQTIENAFRRHINEGDTMAVSSVVDAIVCYQASVGNGLCDLKNLQLWENGYEAAASATMHLSNGEHIRLHMDTGYAQYKELTKSETDRELGLSASRLSAEDDMAYGTGLSWLHYPSINLLRYQNDFSSQENTAEAKYRRDIFDKKIEKALELKIIECERTGDTYKYYLNILPRDWQDLNVKGYGETDENGFYERGKLLFDYLKGRNSHSSSVFRKQIALQNSPAFGPRGFDFSEIIRLEHWSEDRITKTHKAYMKRIMRKATNLYQTMEDTLYRYYEVEQALKEREKTLVGRKEAEAVKNRARKFIAFITGGVVNPDEDQYEWTVQTSARGATADLITFSRRLKMNLGDFQKTLLGDGFKLAIIYDKYLELLEDGSLEEDTLEDVRVALSDKMSDKQFDQLLDARLPILEDELGAFTAKFGRKKDPVDAIMDAYELEDADFAVADRLATLYQAVADALKSLQ